MPPNTVHVGARIPEDLYNKCSTKYNNMTAAIIAGLELLVQQEENNCSTEENSCKTEGNNCKTEENVCSTDENNNRELRALIEEKDRHIETLKAELEKSEQREEKLNENHRNYMLQMQTLINQKAIEAPGAKKSWWRFW